MGHDDHNRLLLVVFTERNQIIRIISARLATKKERQDYEEYTKF
ncbi:MAG: BrnT family toxin [Rhizonema sp. NSF051]|nr:BrnT family toxin [Rhizonema sp. NSF051]